MQQERHRQNLVKISTASRMSGIRIETLRAWDNRGQFEPIRRVGNTRYYTATQVERMKVLNTLLQSGMGYSIGELCVKSDAELQQHVTELHETPGLQAMPELRSNTTAVIVGWRLMAIRDTSIEDEVNTVAPNIDDIETFYKYVARLQHDSLNMAVIELPSVWDLHFIRTLRERIDQLNHPECHLIAVSFLNDPTTFSQYTQEAQQKGVSLLDGTNLTWKSVLSEIRKAFEMQNEVVNSLSTIIPSVELARLARSNERIGGIAVADIANLYQRIADINGLAQREASQHVVKEPHANQLTHRLRSVHEELAACLELMSDASLESSE